MGSGARATTFGETLTLKDYMRQMHRVESKFSRQTRKASRRALAQSDQDDVERGRDWVTFEAHRFFIATNQYDVKDEMRRCVHVCELLDDE